MKCYLCLESYTDPGGFISFTDETGAMHVRCWIEGMQSVHAAARLVADNG